MTVKDIAIAVIVSEDGRILVARRPPDADHLPGLNEFPGGKVHAGESAAAACARECLEELGTPVLVHDLLLPPVAHAYPERTVRLHFFRCTLAPGAPAPRSLETGDIQWLEPSALTALAWPEANRGVVALLAAAPARR